MSAPVLAEAVALLSVVPLLCSLGLLSQFITIFVKLCTLVRCRQQPKHGTERTCKHTHTHSIFVKLCTLVRCRRQPKHGTALF